MTTASTLLNSTMPRDLRDGGPAAAGAGKTYDVDPAAVERLKQHIAAKQAAPPVASPTAVPTIHRKEPEPEPAEAAPAPPEPADPATLYPTAVIEAAKEQEQANGRRNLAKVLTDDVLAIWDRWNNDGMSMRVISQKANNGLIELMGPDVARYLRRYRERQEIAQLDNFPEPTVQPVAETAVAFNRTSPGRKAVVVKKADIAEPETAVVEPQPEPEPVADVRAQTPPEAETAPIPAQAGTVGAEAAPAIEPEPETTVANDPLPKPEIEALETAVEPFTPQRPENLPPWLDRQWAPPPAPRPGDALAALASLVNNEQLRIKGSVKLNLEIEFGE